MKNEQRHRGLHEYAQTRDRELRDRLFEGLLPLSKAIAAKFTGRGMPREDLEQVAAMGLLKALERYEPDRNLRFVTYAVPTITGDLRNYLRDKGSMVRAFPGTHGAAVPVGPAAGALRAGAPAHPQRQGACSWKGHYIPRK